MNVLLTNDDGIHAEGLKSLIQCRIPGVHFAVAAPATERSACSHSISLGQKLRVEEYQESGISHYAVHGTPADCIKFAISELTGFVPDLIVSGINHGANTGISVYYSGTISAAREGLINGIPSIALSMCSKIFNDFSAGIKIMNQLIDGYRAKLFPTNILLNVNIPALPQDKVRGIKITKQAASRFIEEFVTHESHDGKRVYTLAGEIEVMNPDGTSDEEAVAEGYISITPLKLDLTEYSAMPLFEKWIRSPKGRY